MPGDYVSELAERAFRSLATGTSDENKNFPSLLGGYPIDASVVANQLGGRPDLQAQVASLTSYTPSQWILEHELNEVEERRKKLGIEPASIGGDPYKRATGLGLTGLCFSGGGIRSATFNLGILQGLAELKLLRCFDYLSSVSGGGYIHQWLAAWSKRRSFEEVANQLIPRLGTGTDPEPINWLRRYSNYFSPSILAADTWMAIVSRVRITGLNQAILITGLFFLVLLLHVITSPILVPQHRPGVAVSVGAIFCASLLVIYGLGKNLRHLRYTGCRFVFYPLSVAASAN